jgi:hypothetical protein
LALRLISVPHSGTVFTRYVLGEMGLEEPTDYTSHHTDDLGYPISYFTDSLVVVPVRDPMLCEISRVNRGSGLPVQHWSRLAHQMDRSSVHWFRIDGTRSEVERLAGFLGKETPDIDWRPRNEWNDVTGAKAMYKRGLVHEMVRPAWEWLQQSEEVSALFSHLGYELPWQ